MYTKIFYLYKDGLFANSSSEYLNKMMHEDELLELAKIIKEKENNLEEFILSLLNCFASTTYYNKCFDWNIGSTLQHFEARLVINAFSKVKQSDILFDSIGLSWVLGEFKIKDEGVIEFLNSILKKSNNSEAWWRAAFSLEQLSEGDAIVFLKRSLKAEGIKIIGKYLADLSSKKSVIGILLLSNSKAIRNEIYKTLKCKFLTSPNIEEVINCIWLLGRLKLIDNDVINKVVNIFETSENYELIYYTCYSIQEINSPTFLSVYQSLLNSDDSLLRKMAVRAIANIENSTNQKLLEDALMKEKNPNVISEICIGLYKLSNNNSKQKAQLRKDFRDIENGLIFDDSDKWYADPAIYEVFSNSEDPENICFNLILNELKSRGINIINPIDLATGTGRALRFFIENINYQGKFYGVDKSKEMLSYLKTLINRKHTFIHNTEIVESPIADMNLGIQSNLIMSSFGFPSKIADKELCIKELEVVYNHLMDDGIFITLGWDESFNDELSNYWYRHIPDGIDAIDFETWRIKRRQNILSPRNCNLSWHKTGLNVPLQFNNLKESVSIMGYLFGRDAAENIINKNIIEWSMSLGITLNSKKEIKNILDGNLFSY